MPRARKTAGKSSLGTPDTTASDGTSQPGGRGKPKPPARPVVALKGQKRTRAKSATAVAVSAPLKARQAKPEPLVRSAAPKKAKKPKKNDKVRARLVNAAFFLLLLLAVSVWAEIHLATLKQRFVAAGAVAVMPILLFLLRLVPGKAVSSVVDTVTSWLAGALEDVRITPYVATLVVLGLPLAVWDSYLHHRTYAVRIVLGVPVLEFVQDTDVPPQRLFELAVKVARDEARSARPVTGPGPIYVGASEEYLRWRHGEGSAEEDYKELLAGHPQADNLMKGWSKSPQFLPTVGARPGDALEIELRCPHSEIVYIKETAYVRSSKKSDTILLEPKDRQKFVEALNQCSARPR
jgi:hypothetical protein